MSSNYLTVNPHSSPMWTRNILVFAKQTQKRPPHIVQQPPISPSHYKFFAAGLSHEIFGPIGKDKEAAWCGLISRSGVEDIFANSVPQSVLQGCCSIYDTMCAVGSWMHFSSLQIHFLRCNLSPSSCYF
ncbi:hypothetical protein K439DRAFT_757398 [Ramaria rubella]|nr:hypothetical protein K439DRAFT_757398 [Ramaria rubella]